MSEGGMCVVTQLANGLGNGTQEDGLTIYGDFVVNLVKGRSGSGGKRGCGAKDSATIR